MLLVKRITRSGMGNIFVIALPGWYIDKIGSRTLPVINPAKPHNFFLKQSGDRLTPERITQIAYQLDRVCRG